MVRLRGVGFRYPGRRALRGVDGVVGRGEIFAFLGPNGSGKSTLFRLLATLTPEQEGEIEILGLRPGRAATELRRRLGVVFQAPALDRDLSVDENLTIHGRLFGMRSSEIRPRARQVLAWLGIEDRAGDRVGSLSGGLARRVELAKVLLPGPAVLLLDEPSTGLDPAARRSFWEVLERVRAEEGATVLLTTHFMEEGRRADRLALLSRGEIVAMGRPADLLAELGNEVVAVHTADAARLETWLDEHGIGAENRRRDGDVLRILLPPERAVSELLEGIRSRVESLTVSGVTLEDLFLWRTGESLEGSSESGRSLTST